MTVKAVLFDLDDTLYARSVPFLNAFGRTFPGCSVPSPDALYQIYQHYTNQTFIENAEGLLSAQQMYRIRITKTAAYAGLAISEEEAFRFQDAYDWELEHLQTLPDTAALLSMLQKAGVFLGLLTNGPSLRQRSKYRTMKLTQWIPEEHVIASGDLGHPKPDPEIFLEAVSRWALDPSETWYVGDNYVNDIVPSSLLGWNTIWFDRYGRSRSSEFKANDHPVKPDYLVYSGEALIDTFRSLLPDGNSCL